MAAYASNRFDGASIRRTPHDEIATTQSDAWLGELATDPAMSDETSRMSAATGEPLAMTSTSGTTFSISDASVTEADPGTNVPLTFTITRTSGVGIASVSYGPSNPPSPPNADESDFVAGSPLAGTVRFADGQTSATITLQVQGDDLTEGNEGIAILLFNPQGGTIADDTGIGTIFNDDGATPPPPPPSPPPPPPPPPGSTINGTEGDDTIADTAGGDTINALGGSDTVTVTRGIDMVNGGSGSDTLIVNYADATAPVSGRTSFNQNGPGGVFDNGFDAQRRVEGGSFERVVLTTGSGGDWITAAFGIGLQADAGAGIDRISVEFAAATTAINFDIQTNSFSGVAGVSFANFEYFGGVNTGSGADTIVSSLGNFDETFSTGAGNDRVSVFGGRDRFDAGDGFDTLVVDYSAATTAIRFSSLFAQFPSGFGGRIGETQNLEQGGVPGSRLVDFNGVEAFDITSGSGDDDLRGGDNADILRGGAGNDRLGGGPGADRLIGGVGDDNYFVDQGDIVEELAGEGFDTVTVAAGSFTLTEGAHVEVLTGSSTFGQALTGNSFDNTINGGVGNDVLDGGAGNDTLNGGDGNDTLRFVPGTRTSKTDQANGGAGGTDLLFADFSSSGSAVSITYTALFASSSGQVSNGSGLTVRFDNIERFDVTGSAFNDTLSGSLGENILRGLAGADMLAGGAGNDVLDGGVGADRMVGNAGNDLFIVDDLGDRVEEFVRGGTDEVRTSLVAYTLGANVETLTGSLLTAQDLRGNELDNLVQVLTTNTGTNFFRLQDGGNDRAIGARGNDAFYFGAAYTSADSVDGGTGNDQVGLQGDYTGARAVTLGSFVGVETLILQSGDDARFGDTANNSYSYAVTTTDANVAAGATLTIDANRLRAGEGSTFNGAAETDGRFVYIGGAGRDDVTTGAGDDVIRLGAGGDVARAGAGNDLIDGGAGQDLMFGGTGDDVYIIDEMGDTPVEDANAGTDEVRSDLRSVFLGTFANVENLTGTSNAGQTLAGNGLNNVIRGAAGNDFIDARQGGDDSLFGNAGDDAFLFAGALTTADSVDGGVGGNDQLGIQGDYTGARALTLGAVTNIETLLFLSGDDNRFGNGTGASFGYTVTTNDANVAAGATLTVDANRLRPGENVVFDGSAETDGGFFIFAGQGVDRLTGGAGSDIFLFREPGGFTSEDRIVGGGGFDQLGLRGNYSVSLSEGSILGLEGIVVISGRDTRFGSDTGQSFRYDISTADDAVTAGQTFTIDAGTLRADETLRFSGLREFDGNFRIFGGDGADNITGGFGNDVIRGGLGADRLWGFEGADVFRYDDVAESTAARTDTLDSFQSGRDKIDLSRIDADQSNEGGNDAFRFIGSAAFSGSAGELRTVYDAGTRMGRIEGDVNGDGVADLVIVLDGLGGDGSGNPQTQLTANDFFF